MARARLEDFFSTPDFTSAVRAFVDEHESAFVYVEEGEEQPLGNYDLYLKYTKLIEELLENFLSGHGIDQQVRQNACQCSVGPRASLVALCWPLTRRGTCTGCCAAVSRGTGFGQPDKLLLRFSDC